MAQYKTAVSPVCRQYTIIYAYFDPLVWAINYTLHSGFQTLLDGPWLNKNNNMNKSLQTLLSNAHVFALPMYICVE